MLSLFRTVHCKIHVGFGTSQYLNINRFQMKSKIRVPIRMLYQKQTKNPQKRHRIPTQNPPVFEYLFYFIFDDVFNNFLAFLNIESSDAEPTQTSEIVNHTSWLDRWRSGARAKGDETDANATHGK